MKPNDPNQNIPSYYVLSQNLAPNAVNQQHLLASPVAKGDIYYGRDGVHFARVGIGLTGQVLTVSNGVPVWQYLLTTGVAASRPTSGAFTGAQYFSTDTFILSVWTGSVWKSTVALT